MLLNSLVGKLPSNKNVVLHFDTEMSNYHLHKAVDRVCRLTNQSNPPNYIAYGLRKFDPSTRRKLIEYAIYNTQHLGLVCIDGLKDLLSKGINDEPESIELVSDLMRWTTELDIHIIAVLHQNKGDQNARGHIGTECVNKAETVLSVTKSDENSEVSIVECEYSRDLGFEPFMFTINEDGLPEAFEACNVIATPKSQTLPDLIPEPKHIEVLNSVFRQNSSPKYRELWCNIKLVFGEHNIRFGDNKAKEYVSYYERQKFISKEGQFYKYTRALF